MDSASYQYKPLRSAGEFRLLEVFPTSESSTEPLRCTLLHRSLKRHGNGDRRVTSAVEEPPAEDATSTQEAKCAPQAPSYEAISYFWGDPTRSSMIYVDNRALYLPANSERALRRMALPNRKRVLYLDAVCINQVISAERADQVSMMGDIYRQADATLIHLGDADESVSEAFDNIHQLHRLLIEKVEPGDDPTSFLRRMSFRVQQPPELPVRHVALSTFCKRPWFRRVWVVQEVALARRSVMHCGRFEIDTEIVLQAMAWLYKFVPRRELLELYLTFWRIVNIWTIRNIIARDGGMSLRQILDFSRPLQSSDARDKIFGMLGLMNGTPSPTPLLPDYTKHYCDVLADAVRLNLDSRSDPLGILAYAIHSNEADLFESGLASWVPRIHRERLSDSGPLPLDLDGERAMGDIELARAVAHDHSNARNVLALSGIPMCTVLRTSHPFNSEIGLDRGESILEWTREVARMLPSDNFPDYAFTRTLRLAAKAEYEWSFTAELAPLSALVDLDGPSNRIPLRDCRTSFSPEYAWSLLHLLEAKCSHRRFAIFDDGSFGLLPQLARPTDLVVMLHGAKSPFVLTQRGAEFLLVGEVYVDGWMSWQEHGKELEARLQNEPSTVFRIV